MKAFDQRNNFNIDKLIDVEVIEPKSKNRSRIKKNKKLKRLYKNKFKL